MLNRIVDGGAIILAAAQSKTFHPVEHLQVRADIARLQRAVDSLGQVVNSIQQNFMQMMRVLDAAGIVKVSASPVVDGGRIIAGGHAVEAMHAMNERIAKKRAGIQ
jgi:hypothetical protein